MNIRTRLEKLESVASKVGDFASYPMDFYYGLITLDEAKAWAKAHPFVKGRTLSDFYADVEKEAAELDLWLKQTRKAICISKPD